MQHEAIDGFEADGEENHLFSNIITSGFTQEEIEDLAALADD